MNTHIFKHNRKFILVWTCKKSIGPVKRVNPDQENEADNKNFSLPRPVPDQRRLIKPEYCTDDIAWMMMCKKTL